MATVAPNSFVFHSYDPGFIVLSYVVSVIGCTTALELLHRRTSSKGLYNWYLLVGAATAMGAVAIWAMHFIGNRAINMQDGSLALQIGYSPAYSAGSFFLPICFVGVAFYLFTITEQVTVLGIIIGGFLAGFAICGMHYLGQGGISNYHAVYDWRYVLGSAIIAVVAATVALGIFFYFKSGWTNRWWKRIASAALLAVAVSGMHWVATAGTNYVPRPGASMSNQQGLSRRTTVVVVLCLAVGCCITLIVFAAIGQRSRQLYANRAQQVVLACATFDQEGRILVTPGGLLPCRKITNSYIERSFDDIFTIEHPVFCWIFRASRYWQGVVDMIPGMRSHIRITNYAKRSRPGSAVAARDVPEGNEDYSQVFKELFCVAAADLAGMLNEPLENLGVLHDQIMSTGTLKKSARAKMFSHYPDRNAPEDTERASTTVFGRGQLLFIVREVNKLEANHLLSSGYRFAQVHQVIEPMARSMQITVKELQPRLDRMRVYPMLPRMLEPGVHLGCFALRPLFQRGFEILVPKDAKNLLPTVKLPFRNLEDWQISFINRFEDWDVSKCLQWLSKQSVIETVSERDKVFFGQLYNGIYALSQQINAEFFQIARLTARRFTTPSFDSETGQSGTCQVIAFRIIADVHQSKLLNDRVEFTSIPFFLAQQHIFPNSGDHRLFARRMHREFAAMFDQTKHHGSSGTVAGVGKSPHSFFTRTPTTPTAPRASQYYGRRSTSPATVREDNSSEKGLVDMDPGMGAFGGIHVSNEVTIDVSEVRRGDSSPNIEMSNLGVRTEAGVDSEKETFIDELMAITIQERRQQKQ